MPNILKVIEIIEGRPQMFLGELSISHLECFLLGYRHCMDEIDPARLSQDDELQRFGEWVRAKYNVTSSRGWRSVILFWSAGEADALSNFFRLWREFLESQKVDDQQSSSS